MHSGTLCDAECVTWERGEIAEASLARDGHGIRLSFIPVTRRARDRYRNRGLFLTKGEPSSREQNIHCLLLLDGRKIFSKNNSLLRCLVRENGGFLSRHLEIHFSNFVLLSPLSESCRWQRDVLTLSSLSIPTEDKGKCCKEEWVGTVFSSCDLRSKGEKYFADGANIE